MKKLLLLLIILLANLQNVIGQDNIKLSIVESTNSPNSESIHFYKLKIENLSSKPQTFTLNVDNRTCLINDHKEHQELKFEFYDETKTRNINNKIVIENNGSIFYLKTTRPNNSKLSTWNCSNIFITNTITSERAFVSFMSFLQDPKNVH